jgi:hypothetical protein
MPGRWSKIPTKPNTQTYEFDPCTTSVVGHDPADEEAARQLQHANQQLELTRQYPGRQPEALPDNVISLQRREPS